MSRRVPLRFDPGWRWLFGLLFLRPSDSYVSFGDDQLEVRLAWAFRARFPRRAVASATPLRRRVLSLGVHGFFGRWLVNGSSQGLVSLEIHPPQRAWVMGFPIRLRELTVSVDDPEGLVQALSSPPASDSEDIAATPGRLPG